MSTDPTSRRALIEGRPVLVVGDILAGTFRQTEGKRAIPHMEGYAPRMAKARQAVDTARACQIPVVFIQEVHRRDGVDFGRELDGDEDIHCLEDDPNTEVAAQVDYRPTDYLIRKRRYSAFFGTDLVAVWRSHRRLCALHLRRRSPVRLLLPRHRGLRRRV